MGYISIFLGLAVVVALMIRRWSPLMVGIVAATVVILMNGLPFGETMTGTYFDGFCTMFKSLFPPIFSGSLLAQVYNRSGAVNAVGDAIANALFKDSASATRKYVSCILAMAIASGILAFCGLNALVTLIAMYPIALRLMERAGIPKRFVMGILSCGVYTFAMSAPGSAELVNILAMQSLNTPSYAGICGGILACITEIAVTTTLTTIMIKKDVAKGKTFAYGPKDIVASNDQPRPKALVALLPLLALVLLFNIFSIDIFSSTMIAWLFSIVLFWKYLPKKDGKRTNEMLDVFTAAGTMAFGPCSAVGSIVGFTSIVQTLPEFQAILNYIFSLNMAPFLVLILSINIVGALTGSSSSAIRIGMPMAMQHCIDAGMSLAFVQRLGAFAASILDTLPHSSAIIINLGIADQDMKEAYPPMAVTTILTTAVGTAAVAIFMSLFPSLP